MSSKSMRETLLVQETVYVGKNEFAELTGSAPSALVSYVSLKTLLKRSLEGATEVGENNDDETDLENFERYSMQVEHRIEQG